MKKITKVFAVIASLAAIFSCDKEIEVSVNPAPEQSGDMVEMTIIASGAVDEGNKTAISGNNVVWNSTGEYLKVFQDKGGTVSYADSSEGVTTDEGATMTFGVSFAAASGTSFKYYAFYPKSALQSSQTLNTEASLASVRINTPAAQTPTATSFDPAADLLIAKMVDNGGEQATSLNMQFARVVAVGKMTITNLGSDEDVKKVTFSAKQGSTSVNLAGRTAFNLTTAQHASEYGSYVGEKAIHLDYSALSLKANTSMDAFFVCYPFDLVAGDSFTVEVQTESKTFTREVTLTGAQKLSFKPGTASRFSVNMSTADEVDNAVDLRYACLTGAEFNAAGGTSSYGNITVSKPYGDKWVTYAQYTSSSIGIRNNASTNDSYVKLPDLVESIKTVVVTFASASTDNTKKITLETTATGKTGDIMSKNFGDMDASNRVTFDLTSLSSTYNTAYVRSNGAQAVISKIEVYAGEDNRAATAPAPATVTAALNGSDSNTIDVSWTAASGAAGYIVTLTPNEGDPVIKNAAANATSISFNALPSSTTFTPSVATVADPYIHKANSASQSGAAIATPAPAITTIAGIKARTSGSEVAFSASLTDALVTVVSGNQFYMEDASGAVWVNTTGHGMSVGDKISGNISGTVKKYNSNFQILNFVSSSATKTTGNTVSPTVVDAATLAANFADYESKYVKVEDVTIASISGANLTLSGVSGWIAYNSSSFDITAGSRINAVGIACFYNSTKEVKLFDLAEADKLAINSRIVATDKSVAAGATVSIGATKNTPASISYVSQDETVATVNSSGVITGVAAGSTTITMTTAASGVYSAAEKVISVTVTAAGTSFVYTFSSKSWEASLGDASANWTSGQDGSNFTAGQGVQVTTSVAGANATSPKSFTGISRIVVTYNTNKSAGAGSIVLKVGSNDDKTNACSYSGSGDGRSSNFTTAFDYTTKQNGNVKITVNTTTNSLYIKSIEIIADSISE